MYQQHFKKLCSQVWFVIFFNKEEVSFSFWLFPEVMSEDNKNNQQNKFPC